MLDVLKISNLAVIQEAEIQFKNGLNILSGETGAGKSIIIEAVGLLLGERADAELVRGGSTEGTVEGLFDIRKRLDIRARLEKHGFESPESGELLIKRVIATSGKHRVYINASLSTLSVLQEVTDGLIDLCAQHEHQSLLKPQVQLELLDNYGGLSKLSLEVSSLFSHVRSIRNELKLLINAEQERNRKTDFLKFQLDELDAAQLESDEDIRLSQEKSLVQSSEKRLSLAHKVLECLAQESDGALLRIQDADKLYRQLNDLDPDLSAHSEQFEYARQTLIDIEYSLSKYISRFEADPDRLNFVQERLALIASLRRKYGATVNEMLANRDRMRNEFDSLSSSNERRLELEKELESSQQSLLKSAQKLSHARKNVAKVLADSVTAELKDLRMSEARFLVLIESHVSLDHWTHDGCADQISFEISANPGEDPKPLHKVASGGELSRLMLSLRRVISNQGGIGIYLFDEIDAGIGGKTAFEVGRKLKSVSTHSQVICITHLPQIACFASHHLSVEKHTRKGRTETKIVVLHETSRSEELARMLGGEKITPSSIKNARELIAQAAK